MSRAQRFRPNAIASRCAPSFCSAACTDRSRSDARVMVHQIWLGDRREDPTAANYSAEDLVLVQRDIGRLAQYTAEMGATADLLDLALAHPAVGADARADARGIAAHAADDRRDPETPAAATVATSSPPPARAAHSAHDQRRACDGNQRAAVGSGRSLGRRDTCPASPADGRRRGDRQLRSRCCLRARRRRLRRVSYVERRHAGDQTPAARGAEGTSPCGSAGNSAALKVVSSERRTSPDELVTYAAGRVPATLIGAFAAAAAHSMLVKTESATARDRNPAGQYRRFAEPSAAFGELQQAARRSSRSVASEDRRPCGSEIAIRPPARATCGLIWPRSGRAPKPPHRT